MGKVKSSSSSPPSTLSSSSSVTQSSSIRKSSATCIITLANAYTIHSSHPTIHTNAVPFPRPPKLDHSVPLTPVKALRPHPLLPVHNIARTASPQLSKSDQSPRSPPVPRQRVGSIKKSRKKRRVPSTPMPSQLSPQIPTTRAEPQGVHASIQAISGVRVSVLRPQKSCSDIRSQALAQRSIARRSCLLEPNFPSMDGGASSILPSPTRKPTSRSKISSPQRLISDHPNMVANAILRHRHKARMKARGRSGSGSSLWEDKDNLLEWEMERTKKHTQWEMSRPKRSSPLRTVMIQA